MELDFSKFDQFTEGMAEFAERIGLTSEYSLQQIFPPLFMVRHTQYDDIDSFFQTFGYPYETDEDLERMPQPELDQYVAANSDYTTWEGMFGEAYALLLQKNLGL